ncbi:MAG: acyl carrier protein [Steroidobacteraceae bacterium]
MTTLEQLSQILVQHYKIDPARLTVDAPLESLGIDSLGMAELLFFIEDEFHLTLPADAQPPATLGAAVSYVDGLLDAQHGAGAHTGTQGPRPPA